MRGLALVLCPILSLFLFSSCMTCGGDGAGDEDDDSDDDSSDNVPGAPLNLTATPSGTMSIWLEWGDADEWEDGFLLERSTDGESFEQVAELPRHHEEFPSVYYEDTGLTPDTTYYYRVRAFNEYGFSDYSNVASATTLEWEGFSEPVYYDVGTSPRCVRLGDLDENSALDTAVVNYDGSSVSILLNNGGGSFAPRNDYEVGDSPGSVAIADFNGDTYPDLAVANGYSNSISVLFNEGDGTFGPAVDYEVDGRAYSISAGDFDNDSDVDLAVAVSNGGGKLAILMNDGDGTFASPVYYEAEALMSCDSAVGNLSEDNDLDIVTGDFGGGVSVFLNKGNGSFHSPVRYEEPKGDTVALGDFDGDSSLDIAVTPVGTAGVGILFNDGDGTFSYGGEYSGVGSSFSLSVGDFDLDGDVDIVVVGGTGTHSTDPGLVSFYINQGDGTFVRAIIYDIEGGVRLRSVAVGDLDNDTDPDVVAVAYYSDVVVVLFNLLIP